MSSCAGNILFSVGESRCYSLMFIVLFKLFYCSLQLLLFFLFVQRRSLRSHMPTERSLLIKFMKEPDHSQTQSFIYMYFQYDQNIISSVLHMRKCDNQFTEPRVRIRHILGLYLGPERVTRGFLVGFLIFSWQFRDSTSNWPMTTSLHILSNFYLEPSYKSTLYSLRCSQHYNVIHKQKPSFRSAQFLYNFL
jgi:hypothetical protein